MGSNQVFLRLAVGVASPCGAAVYRARVKTRAPCRAVAAKTRGAVCSGRRVKQRLGSSTVHEGRDLWLALAGSRGAYFLAVGAGLVSTSRHVAGTSGKARFTGFHSMLGRISVLIQVGCPNIKQGQFSVKLASLRLHLCA
jgi:hypothetical protein